MKLKILNIFLLLLITPSIFAKNLPRFTAVAQSAQCKLAQQPKVPVRVQNLLTLPRVNTVLKDSLSIRNSHYPIVVIQNKAQAFLGLMNMAAHRNSGINPYAFLLEPRYWKDKDKFVKLQELKHAPASANILGHISPLVFFENDLSYKLESLEKEHHEILAPQFSLLTTEKKPSLIQQAYDARPKTSLFGFAKALLTEKQDTVKNITSTVQYSHDNENDLIFTQFFVPKNIGDASLRYYFRYNDSVTNAKQLQEYYDNYYENPEKIKSYNDQFTFYITSDLVKPNSGFFARHYFDNVEVDEQIDNAIAVLGFAEAKSLKNID